MLKASRAQYPFVDRAFADGGYAGRLVRWARDNAHIVVEIVKRDVAAKVRWPGGDHPTRDVIRGIRRQKRELHPGRPRKSEKP